jgi:RNA polymerase sigma-70 factor, ECF subfamily
VDAAPECISTPLRVLLPDAYLGHTLIVHHQRGINYTRNTDSHAGVASSDRELSPTRRCKTHPMATETCFRDPAVPGQAISLTRADDETTRAVEGWAPPSWEQVVRDHADRVYRLAYRLSGNPHDAEDLTQETFIRVFRSLGSYKPGTFEGWLHRITTNLFLDMVRRRSRLRMEGLPEDTDRLVGGGPSPEQVYAETHLDPDLQEALDDLVPEFRAAVVLCDVEGLSYEEIGATLGVKLGTVRSRIHRGRLALRVALERRRAFADKEVG